MVCIDASDGWAARLELCYSAVCVPSSYMITRYVTCATRRLEILDRYCRRFVSDAPGCSPSFTSTGYGAALLVYLDSMLKGGSCRQKLVGLDQQGTELRAFYSWG